MRNFGITHVVFLRGLSGIFFVAFASLYVQLPGLFGCDGLTPINSTLSRVSQFYPGNQRWFSLPSLLYLAEHTSLPLDTVMDVLCLAGMVLSFINVLGFVNAPLLLALWAIYASFLHVGHPFLSFQVATVCIFFSNYAVGYIARGSWICCCVVSSNVSQTTWTG